MIEGKSTTQQEYIKNLLDKEENLVVREGKSNDPKIMITGLEKGQSKDSFCNELLAQNQWIEKIDKEGAKNMRVVWVRPCRNPKREN